MSQKIAWQREEMTPLERAVALATGKTVDRLQCKPSLGEQPSRLIGASIREYLSQAKVMANAQVEAFKLYGQDSVSIGPDQFGVPEALGAKLRYFEDNLPQMSEPILRREEDLCLLKKAIDPSQDGRLPIFLAALEIIRDRVGHLVKVSTGIGGPFTAAAYLRGGQQLLTDLYKRPAWVHILLQYLTEQILIYLEYCWQRGFSCSIGEPLASNNVISVRHFREFVKPYLSQIGNRVKEQTGKGYSIHICGDTQKIWLDMVETGAVSISLDNQMDLAEAKKVIGYLVALSGNIPPVDVLLNGNDELIHQAVRSCIHKAYNNPRGYVVGTGCRVPLNTPSQNIMAMLNAVRLYGKMPVIID